MDALGSPLGTFTLVTTSEASPSSKCRLWLPLDTLYGLRYNSGAYILVSLVGPDGVSQPLLSTVSDYLDSNNLNKDTIGDVCVIAEVWPSQKLRNGTAAISDGLTALLGSPPTGASLLLHKLPDEVHVHDDCSLVELEFCRNVQADDGCIMSSRGRGCGGAGEATKPPPASPTASPAQRGRQPSIRASPPSMKISAGDQPVTPNLLPLKESKAGGKKSKEGRESLHIGAANSNETLEAHKKNDIKHLESIQRLLKDDPEGKLRDIIQILARQVLEMKVIMKGNIVGLPLVGVDVFLRVKRLVGSDNGDCTAGQVTAVTMVTINGSTSQEKLVRSDSYAARAAKAAAEALEEDESNPGPQGALQAAQAGEKSLQSVVAELGGLKSQLEILEQSVIRPLQNFAKFVAHNIFPPSGVLFHGPPGTGKTALARLVAKNAGATFFIINGPDIVSEYFGESENCLKGIFAAARSLAPSVIFIDEIDAIAPSRGGSSASNHSTVSARLVTTLLTELDASKGYPVVILAATNRLQALDESLRRPGRLDKEIEIGVPSPADRLDILRKKLSQIKHSLSDEEIAVLAEESHGFVGADISALCSEAALSALRRVIAEKSTACFIEVRDFNNAKAIVRPSGLREVAIETPKVKWEDIGGNGDIKQQLKEVVQWPQLYQDSISRIGAAPPKGVLLYGPPGCSKTLLARAVAREAKMNFLAIKGPEMFNKYVGESERALQQYFEKARTASPAIIFFDEIDGMIGVREEDSAGGVHVGERILSQLLQEMDGLQNGLGNVIVIAATNRPDCIDPALLRPGRFDRLLYLSPPDQASRRAIFEVHTRAMPLGRTVNIDELAASTEGYSGADIAAVCQQAALIALEKDDAVEYVEMNDFRQAVERIVPGLIDADTREMYESFRRKVS